MNPRILIVDDNQDIHADFQKILGSPVAVSELSSLKSIVLGSAGLSATEEYQLEHATSGEVALEMARKALRENRPYSMAFVDVRMPPGWDGVQTIAEIRKLDPGMGFVICTAYSDYTPEEASRKVGLSNGLLFIIKPFDAELVRQLARQLSHNRQTSAA